MLVQFCIISVVFGDRVSFFLPNHISIDFSVLNSLCMCLYPACRRLLFPLFLAEKGRLRNTNACQSCSGFLRYWERTVIGRLTVGIVQINSDWLLLKMDHIIYGFSHR